MHKIHGFVRGLEIQLTSNRVITSFTPPRKNNPIKWQGTFDRKEIMLENYGMEDYAIMFVHFPNKYNDDTLKQEIREWLNNQTDEFLKPKHRIEEFIEDFRIDISASRTITHLSMPSEEDNVRWIGKFNGSAVAILQEKKAIYSSKDVTFEKIPEWASDDMKKAIVKLIHNKITLATR